METKEKNWEMKDRHYLLKGMKEGKITLIYEDGKFNEKISYDEMLELSSLGAKVMQSSAVQTAMMYDIPLEVKSTFTERKGTKIFSQENIDYTKSVTGVAYSKDDAKITIIGVEDRPGVAANIFEPLSKAQINVDMVIQNISSCLLYTSPSPRDRG